MSVLHRHIIMQMLILNSGRRFNNYALGYITFNKDVDEITLVMKGCVLGMTSAAFSPGCVLDARLSWQILPHKSALTKR